MFQNCAKKKHHLKTALEKVFSKKNLRTILEHCNAFSKTVICLTLLLLNTTRPVLANSVDPDQLASEESALFVIKYVIFSIKNPDQVIWLDGN